MRVRLNLATKALETHRRFVAAAGALAMIGGITFLILGWHVYSVRKADSEFRAQSEDIRQKMAANTIERDELDRYFKQPENDRLHDRSVFLNSIIDARSFNWTLMFMDLERVMPGGVRLISIQPQQVKGHVLVKLRVGASDEEAKLKFIRALESSKEFSGVELVSERAATAADQGDRETIELTVVYSRT
jgi:type IV pilus assembly protein PilN